MEAVDNAHKKVRVKTFENFCDGAKTKTFGKHGQLYSFADKTTDPEALKMDLGRWPSDVSDEKVEVLKAREYIDGLP